MARPREFDETKVLEAAMNCFWAQGFEQTSLRDLTERMRSPAPAWHRRRTTELAYRSQVELTLALVNGLKTAAYC